MHALPEPRPDVRLQPANDAIFHDIAQLAAQLCGAKYAAITLHDRLRHTALAVSGTLDLAAHDSRFCCEVLHSGAPVEVSDAAFDMRFHDDPLVTGGPRIRFYSGVPLVGTDGRTAGTLSVMHPSPKVMTGSQRAALWQLADVVMRLLTASAAREAAEEALSWQATHDALTELANRREFETVAARQLESARRNGARHAVLFIDLDQFKVVNDTCGHLAGDALLRSLSEVLAARTRRSDTLARLGGDEFGVLLEGCDLAHAQRLAGQLLGTIRAFRFAWEGRVFALGASIGVAEITAESRDLESVLSAADTACYLAKDKGRNQVQVYRADDEEVSSRHGEMSWVSRITQCVEENRLFLHCQKVMALDRPEDDADEYLELLLRMRDEQDRVVPPMAFIPAAERYHLMGTIDRWVVAKTFACLARIRARAPSGTRRLPRFGVNLSGMSLGDPAFEDFVLEALERNALAPGAIVFEITETAAISNLARAARFMRRFRDLGCRFALDDFGSGLSSFAYLKSLPVDYLKIDGSFVRGIAEDRIDHAVIDAINRLGKDAGARTIAECVESQAVLERVRGLRIDCVQGHQIHRPEPYALLAARMHYPAPGDCAVHAA
jgi:diguanylate cyclase (GGDEF)-like protein